MGTRGSNGMAGEFVTGVGNTQTQGNVKGRVMIVYGVEARRGGLNMSMLGTGQVEGAVSSRVGRLSGKRQVKER